jgi:tetratricopeptide (TPR) repeat protein
MAVILLVVLLVSVPILIVSNVKNRVGNEKKELLRLWNEQDYEQTYKISESALFFKPMDYFLLTINGFSAYQLGISQININNSLVFIDAGIQSLRKALLLKESANDGRVFYVLGKAYSYKGNEYADLAIKYLEAAQNLSYNADDISEYLGIAYAAIGDYRGSVEAFTQALASSEKITDTLLLSIARSYVALEEYNIAKAYLQRCIEISLDSKSIRTARFLLADVYMQTQEHEAAENQFISIINETGENAEVHFQLGELYNLRGDATRARSEWRLAYRLDPAHTKARTRLNI